MGLVALSVVPIAAGAVRLRQLSSGLATDDNARFFAAPVLTTTHIVAIAVFSLLGALQFVPTLRRGRRRWHRALGRVVVPAGLAAAASGLLMTHSFSVPATDSQALTLIRLAVGAAMLASLTLGFFAIRRRDVARHEAWMLRAYALGMGAGTQVFTNLPWVLWVGAPSPAAFAVLMGAGWGINVLLAEWLIARRPPAMLGDISSRGR